MQHRDTGTTITTGTITGTVITITTGITTP